MAKPYTDYAGSALHVHASIIDDQGRNILDAAGGEPKKLKSICAGLLQTLQDAQLVFAPWRGQFLSAVPAGLLRAGGSYLGLRSSRNCGAHSRKGRAGSTHRAPRRGRRCQSLPDAGGRILGGMLLGLQNELDPGEETTPSHVPENAPRLTARFSHGRRTVSRLVLHC